MKKTGAPVCTDAPVCDQTLYELPVDAAFGIVYDLLDFKFVFSHGVHPFFVVALSAAARKRVQLQCPYGLEWRS